MTGTIAVPDVTANRTQRRHTSDAAFLDREEAAERLRISVSTLDRQIKAGKLRAGARREARGDQPPGDRPVPSRGRDGRVGRGVVSPPAENAPAAAGGAPETIAAKRSRTQATNTARHKLALARAGALVVATSAMATGALEPSAAMLEATSALASSLHWDLWILAEGLA